jgi:hypothetical protein
MTWSRLYDWDPRFVFLCCIQWNIKCRPNKIVYLHLNTFSPHFCQKNAPQCREGTRKLTFILSCDLVTVNGFFIDDRIYWTFWYSSWLHFTVHTHTSVHSNVFTIVAWWRLPNADVTLPLGSRSYQLLRATAQNDGTAAVLLIHSHSPTISSLTDWLKSQRVIVTLRLAVYRQTLRLGTKPLEEHDQSPPNDWNPCGHRLCVTSSLTKGLDLSLINRLHLCQVYVPHI